MSRLAVVTVVAAVVALSGCSAGGTSRPAASAPVTGSASPTTASATTSASAHPSSSATVVPSPGSTRAPGTRSGSLSRGSFPTPARLGAGWSYSVDPGDAEEGYAGNGTPALARNPAEVVQTAVPLGCARPAPMPLPRHALEVDYRLRGAKVVAVRGTFASAAGASQFFSGRERNLRGCAGRVGSTAIGPLVAAVNVLAPGAVVSSRTPRSDPWREVSVLDADSVVLVAVQGPHPLTPVQTRRLVGLFRS